MLTPPLTPRERFARILAHQPADRVPIDLEGTSLTSLHPQAALRLKAALGIVGEPPPGIAAYDERLLAKLGVDFRRVGWLVGSGNHPVAGHPGYQEDMWGVGRAWTGQYWDIVHFPLKGATIDDLEAYPWPDPEQIMAQAAPQLEQQRVETRRLWQETEAVVVAEHPVYGVLELACWMCGFDDFLWRIAGDQPFVRRLFDIFADLQRRFIRPYYQALGETIHLTTSGDDFGTQRGPFLSPRAFRSLVKPYLAERIAFTRQFTPAAFWHHTCGSVYDLIPDLIEAGVEILNPIQPGAYKMEADRLKADFGSRICFQGGMDTQQILPFGTPAEVEAEVRRLMEIMKPGGGYIFSAAHNIQEDIPPENLVAMFHAAQEFGKY